MPAQLVIPKPLLLRPKDLGAPRESCAFSAHEETRIWRASSSKWHQKPYTPLKEILQIIYSILEQRQPVDAHAECESGNFFRIVSVVLHELEHVGIDHAAGT